MPFTLCTSGAMVAKAGNYANASVILSGALMEQFSNDCEGNICLMTRYDWVAAHGSVGTNFKTALSDACAALAGNEIIKYNSAGFPNNSVRQDLINMNYDRAARAIEMLKDKKTQETMI